MQGPPAAGVWPVLEHCLLPKPVYSLLTKLFGRARLPVQLCLSQHDCGHLSSPLFGRRVIVVPPAVAALATGSAVPVACLLCHANPARQPSDIIMAVFWP